MAQTTFDRIVMAPALDTLVDTSLAQQALANFEPFSTLLNEHRQVGDALFLLLALSKLAPGGRAVVMVPDELFENMHPRYNALREIISRTYELKAVISLDSGTLYPFTADFAAIVVINNHPPFSFSQGWTLRVRDDGYPHGRNRGLAKEPTDFPNDLPLVEAAVLSNDSDFQPVPVLPSEKRRRNKGLVIRQVTRANGQLQGVIVKALGQTTLMSVRKFRAKKGEQDEYDGYRQEVFLLATYYYLVSDKKPEEKLLVIPLTPESTTLQTLYPARDEQDVIRHITFMQQIKSIDIEEDASLSNSVSDGRAIAITAESVVCGSTQWLIARPTELVGMLQKSASLPQIVSKGRRLQAEQAEVAEQEEPFVLPRLYEIENFPLRTRLSPGQQALWEKIYRQTDANRHYALPFFPYQLTPQGQVNNMQEQTLIESALDLFDRMGLIVRVNTTTSQAATSTYYRRIVTSDIHRADAETESEQA